MRLIELQILAFGQFKNRRFAFEPGLSIIYGENEQGKSTLLACLKVMFFGFTSHVRSIRGNERLRFQPWDGSRLAANLVFEHQGIRYRLERSFGKTKTSDKCLLMNDITGQAVELPSQQEVGPALFQVTAEEFANTVFIGQLQCTIGHPDDSTLGKLSNLAGSLDEGVSQQALDSQLKQAQVRLRADRGPGGLIPELQRQLEDYETLRQEAIRIESGQQERLWQLDELKQQIDAGDTALALNRTRLLQLRIADKKDNLERLKIRQKELVRQEDHYRDQLEAIRFKGRVIGRPDIESMRSSLREARSIQADLDNEQRILRELTSERDRTEAVVRGYAQLEGVSRSMLNQTSARIEAVHLQIERMKQARQFADLTARAEQARNALHDDVQTQQAIEQDILELGQTKGEPASARTNQAKSSSNLLLALAAVLAIGGIIAGLSVRPIFYAFAALGVLLLAKAVLTGGHKRNAKQVYESHAGERQVLQAKLERARERVSAARNTVEQIDHQLNLLRVEISPDAANLVFSAGDLQQLQAEEKNLNDRLADILDQSGSISLLDLHIRLNETEKARQALTQLDESILREQVEANLITAQAAHAWQQLQLSVQADCDRNRQTGRPAAPLTITAGEIDAIEQQINHLDRQVIACENQDRQIRQLRASLTEALGGQDWESFLHSVEAEIQAAALIEQPDHPDHDQSGETPDELDREITRLGNQVAGWRLQAAALESAVRHSPRTPLMAVEYDQLIGQTRIQLQAALDYYDSLKIARELFQAAFDEMQATFGPLLNEKAAETLRQLTGSRYQNIKVDRSFAVRVEAPEDGGFHEWDYFSGGTVDQIYLSLRLAISELIQSSAEHLPLLLDDIFVQYDDERTAAGLRFLFAKVETDQVQALLLTSHRRIMEMAGSISPAIRIQSL